MDAIGPRNGVIGTSAASAEIQSILKEAGLERTAAGAIRIDDELELVRNERTFTLTAPTPPGVTLDSQRLVGAETFASNLDAALGAYLETADGSRDLNELNAGALLTAFLMLHVDDPTNSPETQNMLYQIASAMRQLGIEEAQTRNERAQTARAEAENYAQQTAIASAVLTGVAVASSAFVVGGGIAAALASQAQVAGTLSSAVVLKTAAVHAGNAAVKMGTGAGASKIAGLIAEELSDGDADPTVKALLQATASLGASAVTPGVFSTELSRVTDEIVARAEQLAHEGAAQSEIIVRLQSSFAASMDRSLVPNPSAYIQDVIRQRGIGIAVGAHSGLKQQLVKRLKNLQADSKLDRASLLSKIQHDTAIEIERVFRQVHAQLPELSPEQLEALKNNFVETSNTLLADLMPRGEYDSTGRIRGSLTRAGIALGLLGRFTDVAVAGAETRRELDVERHRADAKRFEYVADLNQETVDDTSDLMRILIESKNSVVDAVISMQERSFVARQKLMAAQQSV